MNIAKAFKTISLLWIGSLIGAGCAFLTQVILARSLGPQVFSLGFVVMYIVFSLGVGHIVKPPLNNANKSIIFT